VYTESLNQVSAMSETELIFQLLLHQDIIHLHRKLRPNYHEPWQYFDKIAIQTDYAREFQLTTTFLSLQLAYSRLLLAGRQLQQWCVDVNIASSAGMNNHHRFMNIHEGTDLQIPNTNKEILVDGYAFGVRLEYI